MVTGVSVIRVQITYSVKIFRIFSAFAYDAKNAYWHYTGSIYSIGLISSIDVYLKFGFDVFLTFLFQKVIVKCVIVIQMLYICTGPRWLSFSHGGSESV